MPLHLFQVSAIPPEAVVLASSEKTKFEMFAIGDQILGIQSHPEFSKDVMMDIIQNQLSANSFSVNSHTINLSKFIKLFFMEKDINTYMHAVLIQFILESVASVSITGKGKFGFNCNLGIVWNETIFRMRQ